MFCTLFLVWRELFLFVLNLRFFFVYFLFVCFFGICDLSRKGRTKEEKRRRETRDFRVPFGHMGHRRRLETLVKKSLEWSDFSFFLLLREIPLPVPPASLVWVGFPAAYTTPAMAPGRAPEKT